MVREFDYGTVKRENGRTVREFRMIAGTTTLQLNSTLNYITWNGQFKSEVHQGLIS